MGDNVKRRHHTVAQVLLHGFTNERGQLIERPRQGREHKTSVVNATVGRDFYTTLLDDGTASTMVEEWFADHIEGPVGGALIATRRGSALHPDHITPIARFVVSSLLRTRTVQSYLMQIGDTVGPLSLLHHALALTDRNVEAMDPEELRQLRAAAAESYERIKPTVDNQNTQLRVVLRKIDELAPVLTSRQWTVHVGTTHDLLIGDAPVTSIGPERPGWGGVIPDDSILVLPTSPSTLLVGSPPDLAIDANSHGVAPLPTQLVTAANRSAIMNAHRSVFRHPRTPFPDDVTFAPEPPKLPEPAITWRRSSGEQNPPPPPIQDSRIREIMDALQAGSHAQPVPPMPNGRTAEDRGPDD